MIGVSLDKSAIDKLMSSLKRNDNGQNFLLHSRKADLWLRQRPNSIGKRSTLLDKGRTEAEAALYVGIVLRLTTQARRPIALRKKKNSQTSYNKEHTKIVYAGENVST